MTPHDKLPSAADRDRRSLARQAEQATRQLQAGEPIHSGEELGADPLPSAPLRKLLPTLQDLTELGHRLARDRRSTAQPTSDAPQNDGPGQPTDPEETSR